MRHIISLLMENEAGALSRVVGLFSARGFNIDSLSVAATEDATLSRLTLTTIGSGEVIEQIIKQLNKLIEVVKVIDLNEGKFTARELLLIKVRSLPQNRSHFLELITIYRGNVVDVSEKTLTFEVTGTSEKLDAFIALIEPANILEVARTGALGLGRGERIMKIYN